MWAERVTEVNLVSSGDVDSSVDTVQSEPSQYSAKKGWALMRTKRGNRMGENVRSYLTEKFHEGALGGPKADALAESIFGVAAILYSKRYIIQSKLSSEIFCSSINDIIQILTQNTFSILGKKDIFHAGIRLTCMN